MHLPQNWQDFSIPRALSGWPLCMHSMASRRLVAEYFPAVQTAVQLPQDMHLRTSGSIEASSSYLALSKRSRFILELGTSPKPKSTIIP